MPTFLTVGSGQRRTRHRVPAVAVTEQRPDSGLPDSGPADRAVDVPVEGALRRGRHDRALHRLRRLRDRLPARRPRLRPRRRAATSRSTSRTSSARTTASTARRAARRAPGPAPASAPGSPRPTSTSSAGCASRARCPASTKDIVLARASDDDGAPDRARTAASCRRLLIWAMDEGYIDAALVVVPRRRRHVVEGRSRASPRNKEEILASAGSRYTYSANTLAFDEALERGLLEARARRA